MQKKSKIGWIFIGVVFIVTAVSLLLAIFTGNYTKYNSYMVFEAALSLLLYGLFWKYSRKAIRRSRKTKDILLNVMLFVFGIALWSAAYVALRLAAEYFAFHRFFGEGADNVIDYILQQFRYVYTNNTGMPVENAVINTIIYLLAWTESPAGMWEDLKEMKNDICSFFVKDVYAFLEEGQIIFADDYRFAEGKKVVLGVPCKDRIVIFSRELADELSKMEAPDETNYVEMAYFESKDSLINAEIHQNSISLEQLADADLNFEVKYLDTKMLGDFYIIDFLERV